MPRQIEISELPMPEGFGEEIAAAEPAAKAQPAHATLDFVDPPIAATVDLQYPFRLDGKVIETITIRRLTLGEVGAVIDARGAAANRYDCYAVMTGLPAEVLRGLVDVDGEAVVEAAYGFLPRLFLGAAGPKST